MVVGRWLTSGRLSLRAAGTDSVEAVLSRPAEPSVASARSRMPCWPEQPLDGDRAKRILLNALCVAEDRLDRVEGYTATFSKQERMGGKLGRCQKMEMKLRQHPFAVYLKFIEPDPGKEVVFCEGQHDNKVVGHASGFARRLIPRLSFAPTSPLALAENRHPITDAGLQKLTNTLMHYRKMDLTDPEAVTILDRQIHDGRMVYRSVHTHPHRRSARPFARVEVLYDPETLFPIDITSYDWPEEGHQGPLALAEHYSYENLQLTASLTDKDFDPTNPQYAFHRY
jgi:hypothetical protein